MALLLAGAIGLTLVLQGSAEVTTAANYRDSQVALHAADAALERAVAELLSRDDWDDVLAGAGRSWRTDGPPGGQRRLPAGGTIDLLAVVSRASCGREACSPAEMDAATRERPWGPNNPRFQLFAYGPDETRAAGGSYVVVMVGDDPMENDNDPATDGGGEANPGRGRLLVRAESFGPGGAWKAIEAAVFRPPAERGAAGYTGQHGGNESNRASDGGAIPVPVSASTRATIPLPGVGP